MKRRGQLIREVKKRVYSSTSNPSRRSGKKDPLDKDYNRKLELTLEEENEASQLVLKFCLDTGATESVTNKHNFPAPGVPAAREPPYSSDVGF